MFFNSNSVSKRENERFEELSFIFENRIKTKENFNEVFHHLAKKVSIDMIFNGKENHKENDLEKIFNDENIFIKTSKMLDINIKTTPIIPMTYSIEKTINNNLKSHPYNLIKEKGFIQTKEKWVSSGMGEDFGEEINGGFIEDYNLSFVWTGNHRIAIANLLNKTRLRNTQFFHSYSLSDNFDDVKITFNQISYKKSKYNIDTDIALLFRLMQLFKNK